MPIPDAPRNAPPPSSTAPPPAPHPGGSAPAIPADPEGLQPLAAVLAIILPGLGHWHLGEPRRALCIGAGILSMFAAGLLIGGVDVVDRREDAIWFVGEALVGPLAFGVDYLHQHSLKAVGPTRQLNGDMRDEFRSGYPGERKEAGRWVASPGARPPSTKSLGRMNELGTLFCTLAGMLNLIAIIDAAFHARRQRDPAIAHARALLARQGGAAASGGAR
jgi:hypothetical protein